MRGARALLADQPDHVVAVELHREARRELVRHDDHLLVVRQRPELLARCGPAAGAASELDRVRVGQPVAQHARCRDADQSVRSSSALNS